jgi:cyclic beta-1,2-glucan synthetase
LAGDIYSCSPWTGRGGWTWYTGAAGWMWRLGIEAILGFHRDDGHLRIDPCIPPSWAGFEAWLRLGEKCVHFVIENPDRVAGGVARMTLDGATLDSNRICLDPHGTGTHEVHVRLGSPSGHADAPRKGSLPAGADTAA